MIEPHPKDTRRDVASLRERKSHKDETDKGNPWVM